MPILLLALGALADDTPDWAALFSDVGWSQVATPTTKETGAIDLRLKEIGGVPCYRGEVAVEPKPQALEDTVADIAGSLRFSSEDLELSEVLRTEGGALDYVQVLNVPDWTLSADRFWVLRGERFRDGATRGFKWWRFDWRTAYPELAARLQAEHPDAVEPVTNWGAWTFASGERGTVLRYQICADAGGAIPGWIKKAATTRTLPGTVADTVREAARREAEPKPE